MKIKTLGEITSKIGSGATPRGGQSSYQKKGISLIRSQNVHDFKFIKEGLAYINDEQAKKLDNVTVEPGDILFNITGDSIARSCIVPTDLLPARVNQHVSIIRCKEDYDSRFVNYYLINLKPYLMQICKIGGTRNALTKDALERLPIKIPPSQRHIAKILSDLDAKIELNNKINQELEAMAKTLYDYWFVQFDFPAYLSGTLSGVEGYKSSGGKMVYNEELKREIPEGWEVKELDEVSEIKRGTLVTAKTADLEGNIKVVSAGLDYSYLHSESNRERNTITVSSSGANAGFINFWREPIFANDCTTVRGKTDTETLIYLQFLKMRQDYIFKQARGSAQPHVYPQDLSVLKIELPNTNLFDLYGMKVLSANEIITNNLKQNQQLAALRDWLLPMLMNGQVKVEDGYVAKNEVLGMVAEEKVSYETK